MQRLFLSIFVFFLGAASVSGECLRDVIEKRKHRGTGQGIIKEADLCCKKAKNSKALNKTIEKVLETQKKKKDKINTPDPLYVDDDPFKIKDEFRKKPLAERAKENVYKQQNSSFEQKVIVRAREKKLEEGKKIS